MLSLELAATFPSLFKKLIALGPAGLWNEAAPVTNWVELPPQALPGVLFKYPDAPAARAMLAMPDDPEMAVKIGAQFAWNFGVTGKMVWPIPERGLHKRLHRINIPTLIIWGEDDALIPSSYAEEFGKRIKGSSVHVVKDCGHVPQVERLEATLELVKPFL